MTQEEKKHLDKQWAFPSRVELRKNEFYTTMGMTLLDYFAAKAMHTSCDHGVGYEERTAQCAYRLATAMIKEREKHLK